MPMAIACGVDRARPEQGGDHDRHEQGREGKDEIVDAQHQLIAPAAGGGCGEAERDADQDADGGGNEGDRERIARAHHDHGGFVAAEDVGAQPVAGGWRLQAIGDDDGGRTARRPDQRNQGDQQDDADDDAAGDDARAADGGGGGE